jgi:hypothetical protein
MHWPLVVEYCAVSESNTSLMQIFNPLRGAHTAFQIQLASEDALDTF